MPVPVADPARAILAAVADLASSFLAENDWQRTMPGALRRLGTAARVSRAYLFQNSRGPRGRLLTSQRFEWCSRGTEPQIDNPHLQNLHFATSGLDRWPRLLGNGKVVAAMVATMPARERRLLEKEEIRAIAVVPVFVDEQWWGQIGFDDCRCDRQWTEPEIDALRAAAALIGAAVARASVETVLHDTRRFAEDLEGIVHRSPTVAFIWRAEEGWPVEFVSDNVTQFGYSADELLSGRTPFARLVHPKDLERVAQEVWHHTAKGAARFQQLYRIVTRSGSVRWVDDRTTVRRDADGTVTHYEGTVLDVTAHKALELRLAERVKELTCMHAVLALRADSSLTVEQILAGAVHHFPPAMQYPDAACARIRLGRRTWRSKRFRATRWRLARDLVVEGDAVGVIELFYRRQLPDEDVGPFLHEEVELVEEVATSLGLTIARRRAEADRQARDQEFRELFEAANDAMVILDPRGRIVEVNAAAETLNRISRERLVGRRGRTLVHRDDRHYLDDLLAGRGIGAGEVVEGRILPEGTAPLPVSAVGTPIQYRGEPHVLVAMRDISERKRAEQELQESHADLSRAQRIAHLGSWEWDVATGDIAWSDETYRIFGSEPGAFSPTYESFLDRLDAGDRDRVDATIQRALRGEAPYTADYRIARAPGDVRHVHEEGEVIRAEDGRPIRMFGTIQDVTERKRTETALAHAARALTVLYRSSDATFRVADEFELLKALCDIIVGQAGYRLAWIGYAENDAAKTIRPVASAGFERGYLERLNLTWADTARGRGPSGQSIRTRKPVAAQDIEHDPTFRPWRTDALRRGYRSSLAVPFEVPDDHTVGMLAIYSDEANAFDEHETTLLSELANNLANGVATLRAREARRQATAALETSERRYRSLVEDMNDGLCEQDAYNLVTYVNRRMAEMLGYSRDELVGKRWLDLLPPHELGKVRKQIGRRRRGQTGRYELEVRRRDGSLIPTMVSVRPRYDERGAYVGSLGVIADLTEVRAAERKIEALARFPKENPAPVLRLGRSGAVVYANPAAQALLPDTGRESLRCTPEDWQELIATSIRSHRSRTREITCGGRTYSFRIVPIAGTAEVNLYGFDVTERAKAERATEQTSQRLEKIFNGVQVYIWDEDLSAAFAELEILRSGGVANLRLHLSQDPGALTRLAGLVKVHQINDAALPLFGLRSRRSLAAAVDTLLPPEPMDTFVEQLVAIWERRERFETEVEIELADGRRLIGLLAMPVPQSLEDAHHVPVSIFDITERKAAEHRLEYLARYDALTGLANRALFTDRLSQAIARATRGDERFAVHFLDLDHFKDVNDTRGHSAGDQLLQEAGKRLHDIVRSTDTVARFGGDEFGILQTDLRDADSSAVLAAKVVESLAQPFAIDGERVDVTASVGIAPWTPDIDGAETVMSHADMALYRAKAEGRNTYRFHTREMDDTVRSRLDISRELRQALEADELFLVYQPQVDIRTNRIAGVEALVRWRHPERGIVSPATFIPVAEASGLILPLGRWVLRTACRQMRQWLDADAAPPVLAVNLSALQFKAEDLEDEIEGTLAEFRLPPEMLEVELTESVFMESRAGHREMLTRLRTRGVRVALDDFGTGYSSLLYLTKFPVDRIKIAQEFVRDIPDSGQSVAIVGAAISLATAFDITVLAEGVETEGQLDCLRHRGCHQVQGYYCGRPAAPEAVARLVHERNAGGPSGAMSAIQEDAGIG